ncbi:MAG TPA: hypothetical protein PK297_02735 [Spirochaetota bacterium]|nr:hypothetical protein [Spirochaetota bacterium]
MNIRIRRFLVGLAMLFTAVFVLFSWNAGRPPETPAVSRQQALTVMQAIRETLVRPETRWPLPDLSGLGIRSVFLHLDRVRWFRGSGTDGVIALSNLVQVLRLYASTNTNGHCEIFLSFAGPVKDLVGEGPLFWSLTVQQGLDGIALRHEDGRQAWLLPEEGGNEIWAGGEPFGFIPFRFGLSRTRIGAALVQTLSPKAADAGWIPRLRPATGVMPPQARLGRFRTSSWYARIDGNGLEDSLTALYRNTVLPDAFPQPGDVTNAMRAAGEWFLRHQNPEGSFSYRYEPFSGRIDASTYSMPRHAGSMLALYRIFRHVPDVRFARAADRALEYVRQRLVAAPRGKAVAEDGTVKLGTVAITALALTERRVAGDRREDPLLRDLLDFIAFMQKKDGSFCHMFFPPKNRDEVYHGQNFSGQALWALSRGMKIFGGYTNEFVRGMRVQAEGFWDFFLSRYYMFPFTWEMQAIAEAEGVVDPGLLERWRGFAYDCADSMIDFLYDSDWPFPDYRGGYGAPEWFVPLAHAAGFQCEGINGAYAIALRDDPERAALYRHALRETARFVLSQQVTPAMAMHYADSLMPLGGFRAGPADHRQQIDFTQHIIAFLITALEQGVFDGQ